MITIEGVPETIQREAVLGFIRSLGIDPEIVRDISMTGDALAINVFAVDESGRRYVGMDRGAAIHQLTIRLVD